MRLAWLFESTLLLVLAHPGGGVRVVPASSATQINKAPPLISAPRASVRAQIKEGRNVADHFLVQPVIAGVRFAVEAQVFCHALACGPSNWLKALQLIQALAPRAPSTYLFTSACGMTDLMQTFCPNSLLFKMVSGMAAFCLDVQSWRGIKKTGGNGLIGFLGTERTFLQDFPLSGYGLSFS